MRNDWKMRSFPEYDQEKKAPRREEFHIPPVFVLIIPAFFTGLPYAIKNAAVIFSVPGAFFRSFSDALKEFFRAAPAEAAVLTGICIGLGLYCRFRGSKNKTDEPESEQLSAGTSAEEGDASRNNRTFSA